MPDLNTTIFGIIYALTLLVALVAIGCKSVMRAKTRPAMEPAASSGEEMEGMTEPPEPPPILPGKVKANFYRPGDLIGTFLLFLLFVTASMSAVKQPELLDMSKTTASDLLAGILYQMIIPAVVILAVLRLTSLNNWLGLRWKKWRQVLLIAPCSVIALCLVYWVMDMAGYKEWMESMGVETKQEPVALLESTKDYTILALMMLVAVIIAPLWEELVFRGYIYPVLKKYAGVWAAAFCSSLLFAAIHNSLASILPLFLLALVMVWLYERSGSIWMPIGIHACFNSLTVISILNMRNMNANGAMWFEWLPF